MATLDLAVSAGDSGHLVDHEAIHARLADVWSVKEFGAVGDGVTDDTTAIQDAIASCQDAGGGTVYFPDGTYLVNQSTTNFGVTWALSITGDNVHLRLAPGATLKRTTTSGAVLLITGAGKPAGAATWSTYRFTNSTLYTITASIAKGATSVTLATAANAANFSAGDYIYVRTGQTTNNSIANWPEPDSETFKVVSADSGTGIIVLDRPTGKAFAQEYFISGSDGETSTSVTANASLFGAAKVTDRIISNISIEGGRIDTLSTNRNAISAWQVENLCIKGVRGVGSAGFQTGRDLVGCVLEGNVFHMRGSATTQEYVICSASGCSDFHDIRNRFTSEAHRFFHCHEGTVRPVSENSYYGNAGVGSGNGGIDVRARVYDMTIAYTKIAGGEYGIFIDGDCTGGGVIIHPRFAGAFGTRPLRVDPINWIVQLGDGQVATPSVGTNGNSAGPTSIHTLSAWVQFSNTTKTIGTLPGNAYILEIGVYVDTAFNAGSSNRLDLGTGGDSTRYMNNLTDITATGKVATIPAGTGANAGPFIPSSQTAIATYSQTGTTATAGKALVLIKYGIVSQKP